MTTTNPITEERERCLRIIDDAFDRVPYLPMNRDCPQIDIPDLYELQRRIVERIESGE